MKSEVGWMIRFERDGEEGGDGASYWVECCSKWSSFIAEGASLVSDLLGVCLG